MRFLCALIRLCAPNWVRDLRSKPRIWRKGFFVTWNTLNKDRAACFWVGGGAIFGSVIFVKLFFSNLFLFCKKVGGREELKPPPSPSLCAVPLEKVFLFQTKLWLLYFNKEKALEILYNIHHMTKNESRYRTIAIFWVINYYFSKFLLVVSVQKPSESTKLIMIEHCIIIYRTRTVHLNTYKLTTAPKLWLKLSRNCAPVPEA